MAMTAAERKAAQRARDRDQGLTEIIVKIPDTAQARELVLKYCERLQKKTKGVNNAKVQ
jgi:hypothetical protein